MTNSDKGYAINYKTVNVIAYVKGWPATPYAPGVSAFHSSVIPYFDKGKPVPKEWKSWLGQWGAHPDCPEWAIEEIEGQPCVRFRDQRHVKLVSPAHPGHAEGPNGIELVAQGFEIMLRLRDAQKDDSESTTGRFVDILAANKVTKLIRASN
jgi:hypothetical protein